MQPTAQYAEIERKLGEPLADLVAARRLYNISWRKIANEVIERTGVDITGETLRVWCQGRSPIMPAAAASAEVA